MVQKRIELHQKAQQLMRTNSYASAIEVILEAIRDHGPHVGLLCDLASSAYLCGQIDLFVRTTKEIQTQFQLNHKLLSDKSYMHTCLSLGKLLEEIGEVAQALELYEKALLDRELFHLTHLSFCQQVQVQILRLKSYLGVRTGLSEMYQNCSNLSHSNSDLGIEIDHGLMLAELHLLGIEAAKGRFLTLKNKMESSTDLRLVYFDLTEELLRAGHEPIELPFELGDLDYFEKTLFLMTKSPDFSLSIADLQKIQREMSPLCYLRICILNLARTDQPEMRRQIMFLLEGLSHESRQLLLKKWTHDLAKPQERIALNLKANSVEIHDRSLSLIQDGFEAKGLYLLSEKRSIATDELIQKTFGIFVDDFSIERTRIAILRLNKKLSALTGLPKTILFSREKISLHDSVTFYL